MTKLLQEQMGFKGINCWILSSMGAIEQNYTTEQVIDLCVEWC